MKTVLIYFILFISFNVYGQSAYGGITWQRVMNNDGSFTKSQQCSDSNYIAVGIDRIYPANLNKIYLVKFNKFGDTIWTKRYEMNTNEYFAGYWIQETRDKGFIIGGEKIGPDAYLLKTDGFGNIKWSKIFGGFDIQQIYCVKQAPDDGYILALRTTEYGTNDIRMIRTDSSGIAMWDKTFINNNGHEFIEELYLTNNYYYAVGSIGDILTNHGKVLLIKINYSGDTLWSKEIGGTNINTAYSIDLRNENIIIGGSSNSFNSQNLTESYIINLDTSGILKWQKTYNTYIEEECRSVRIIDRKGYIFCGVTYNNYSNPDKAFIKIIDTLGNLVNETFYERGEESNEFRSIELTDDKGFIASGFANYTGQFSKAYIVKTDSLGNSPIGIKIANNEINSDLILYQNYPNPFNPTTKIKFSIFKSGFVNVNLYDINGKEIAILINNNLRSGIHNLDFYPRKFNLSSGIYFYKIIYQNNNKVYQETKKLIYLK